MGTRGGETQDTENTDLTVYLYTVSNLLINVLLLGRNVEKKIIMGVIHGQIFIIIYDIS